MAFSLFLFFVFAVLFFKAVDEIWLEQESFMLDTMISHWMADNHLQEPHDWQFFLMITYLGNGVVLAIASVLIAVLLWFYRRRPESILFLGGFIATGLSVVVFKILTSRMRPDGALFLNETSGAFPSGHAALSFYFFGFLGYLLSRQIKKRSHSLLIFAASLSLAGLIGISRIYLNVHWVTDVLAGFTLAAAVLSLCIGVLETHKLRALQ
jgi:undecaprenyl-diphosphatase